MRICTATGSLVAFILYTQTLLFTLYINNISVPMFCCFFADDTILYDPGSTAIHALICLHSAFKVFSSSYLYHSCLTIQTNGNSRLLNKTFQLQQFELVDICHIYSLFSIKFPHCVSSDSVSLMSFGTRKYFLVCSLVFKYLL